MLSKYSENLSSIHLNLLYHQSVIPLPQVIGAHDFEDDILTHQTLITININLNLVGIGPREVITILHELPLIRHTDPHFYVMKPGPMFWKKKL